MWKIPKGKGKRVILGNFMDPGSPGPSNCLGVKEPARLGEPVSSGLSNSSPGQAAIHQVPFFAVNRHEGG